MGGLGVKKVRTRFLKVLLESIFILCLFLPFAFAHPINLDLEIEKSSLHLRALHSKKKDYPRKKYLTQIQFLTSYLEILDLISKKPSDLFPYDSAQRIISSEFTDWIKKAIQRMSVLFKNGVPADSILEIYEQVLSQKQLSDEPHNHAFLIKVDRNKSIRVKAQYEGKGKIFLDFHEEKISDGGIKNIIEVLSFEDWEFVACLKLKTSLSKNQSAQLRFSNEKRILTAISKLPPLEQMGLVKVNCVGDNIYQYMYEGDLWKLIADVAPFEGLELTLRKRNEIIGRLATGVAQLHQMEICAADIKPENVLVEISQIGKAKFRDNVDAVIADLDLAFRPREHLAGKRPFGGSALYVAPEVWYGRVWEGNTPEEQVQNALKADVFSLGLMVYLLVHMEDIVDALPWLSMPTTNPTELDLMFKKRRKALEQLTKKVRLKNWNSEMLPSEGDLLEDLLLRAMETDVTKRVSSKVFLEEFKQITGWGEGKVRLDVPTLPIFSKSQGYTSESKTSLALQTQKNPDSEYVELKSLVRVGPRPPQGDKQVQSQIRTQVQSPSNEKADLYLLEKLKLFMERIFE